jgi:hypothetical protein
MLAQPHNGGERELEDADISPEERATLADISARAEKVLGLRISSRAQVIDRGDPSRR